MQKSPSGLHRTGFLTCALGRGLFFAADYFGADAALRAASALAASSADEDDDEGAAAGSDEAGAIGDAAGVSAGAAGVAGAGDTAAAGGVTTAGAGSSFLPQADSAAAAMTAASRTDLFMRSP